MKGATAPAQLIWTIAAIALLSFVAGVWLAYGANGTILGRGSYRSLAFYASPTCAWEFLAGVLVVFFERRARRPSAVRRNVATAVGLLAIVAALVFVGGSNPTPGVVALLPVMGVVLIIMGASYGGTLPVTWLLGTRPFVWIGDRSYGWYLWHWPFIVIALTWDPAAPGWVLLIAAVASLVPTELSYRFVEQPIRRKRTWVGWRAMKLAAVCTVIPILYFGATAILRHQRIPMATLPGNPRQAHYDETRGCNGALPGEPVTTRNCTWTVAQPKGHIYLVGDSLAGSFSEVLVDRSIAHGYDITFANYRGCLFADVDQPGADDPASCEHFVATLDRLPRRGEALARSNHKFAFRPQCSPATRQSAIL